MADPTTPVQRAHAALSEAMDAWQQLHRDLGPLNGHLRTARVECHRLGLTSQYEQLRDIQTLTNQLHDQLDVIIDPVAVTRWYLAAVPVDRAYIRHDDGEPLCGNEFEDTATALVARLSDRLTDHDLDLLTSDTRHGIGIQYTNYFMDNLIDALAGRQVPITPDERDIVLRLMDRRDNVDHTRVQSFNVVDQPSPEPGSGAS